MNRVTRLIALSGAALALLALAFGCAEKITDSRLADGKNVVIKSRFTTSASIEQMINRWEVRVTGDGFEPIRALLDYNSGWITGAVEVPFGRDRRFEVAAMEMIYSVPPTTGPQQDTIFNVIFRGVTVMDVLPDKVNELSVGLRPEVPMIKLSPKWTTVTAGGDFALELKVFNVPGLIGLEAYIDYDGALVIPMDVERSSELGPNVQFYGYPQGEGYEVYINANDTTMMPMVDERGDVTIAGITVRSKAVAGAPGQGLFEFVWAVPQFQPGVPVPVDTILYDVGTIELLPWPDREVVFPDHILDSVIRTQFPNVPGPLTLSLLLSNVTSVYAIDAGIADLTGLDACANMEYLDLDYNNFTDISLLAVLNRLYSLSLDGDALPDISVLSGMTMMDYLSLGYCGVADITPLAGLEQMSQLNLHYNQITNISPLAHMADVYQLVLAANQISDINPLASLTNLSYLDLANNNIVDISALAQLPYLYRLDLSYNQIADIYPLVQNTGLGMYDEVTLTGNPLNVASINTYLPQLRQRGVTVIY